MSPACNNARPDGSEAETTAGTQLAMIAAGGLGALATLTALGVFGVRPALGVGAGALLAVLDLWALKRIGQGFLSEKPRDRALWGLVGAFKFAVLLLLVGVVLWRRFVDPIPMLVGLGCLPVGITVGNLFLNRFEHTSKA